MLILFIVGDGFILITYAYMYLHINSIIVILKLIRYIVHLIFLKFIYIFFVILQ